MSRARNNTEHHIETKAVLIGPSAAGKSALLERLIKDQFHTFLQPTIGCGLSTKEFEIFDKKNNCKIINKIHFWDTAGPERFMSINHTYLWSSQIIISVIDGTVYHNESFTPFSKLINEHSPKDALRILVVTKRDKADEWAPHIDDIKKTLSITDVVYCSAQTGEGIDDLNNLLKDISIKIAQTLNVTTPNMDDLLKDLKVKPYITTLNLNHQDIKDTHFTDKRLGVFQNRLISYLLTNKTLTQLNLTKTNVTNAGVIFLEKAMQKRIPPLKIIHDGLEEKQDNQENSNNIPKSQTQSLSPTLTPSTISNSTKLTEEKLTNGQNIKEIKTKAVLIGPSAAGKSALLDRLTKNEYYEYLSPTISAEWKMYQQTTDMLRTGYKINNKIEIWGTPGPERYKSVRSMYLRAAMLVALIIDAAYLDDKDIFVHNEEINRHCPEDVHKILVVNKLDLLGGLSDQEKQLNRQAVENLKKSLNIVDIVYCSAKTGEGIEDLKKLLNDFTIKIYEKRNQQESARTIIAGENIEISNNSPNMDVILRYLKNDSEATRHSLCNPDFNDAYLLSKRFGIFQNRFISYLLSNKTLTELDLTYTSVTSTGVSFLKQVTKKRIPPLKIIHEGLEEKHEDEINNEKINILPMPTTPTSAIPASPSASLRTKNSIISIIFMGDTIKNGESLIGRNADECITYLPTGSIGNAVRLCNLSVVAPALWPIYTQNAEVFFIVVDISNPLLSDEFLQHFKTAHTANNFYAQKILIIQTNDLNKKIEQNKINLLQKMLGAKEILRYSPNTQKGKEDFGRLLDKKISELYSQHAYTLDADTSDFEELINKPKNNSSISTLIVPDSQSSNDKLKKKYLNQLLKYILSNKKLIKLDISKTDLTKNDVIFLKEATSNREPKLHIYYDLQFKVNACHWININNIAPQLIKKTKSTASQHTLTCSLALTDTILASAHTDGTIQLFDTITYETLKTININNLSNLDEAGYPSCLLLDTDSSLLIGTSNGYILAWFIDEPKPRFWHEINDSPITALSNIGHQTLMIGAENGDIYFCPGASLEPCTKLTNESNVTGLLKLPNGNIVTATYDALKLWEIKANDIKSQNVIDTKCIKVLRKIKNPNEPSENNHNNADLPPSISSFHNEENRANTNNSLCYADATAALSLLQNGDFASASINGRITIWDMNGNKKFELAHEDKIINIDEDFTPAASLITAPGNCLISSIQNSTIKIWNLEKRACIASWDGHSSNVTSLLILPTGQLVSAALDNSIRFWNIELQNNFLNTDSLLANNTNPGSSIQLKADIQYPNSRNSLSVTPSNANSRAIIEALSIQQNPVPPSPPSTSMSPIQSVSLNDIDVKAVKIISGRFTELHEVISIQANRNEAEAETKLIASNNKLADYYCAFYIKLRDTLQAAIVINSEKVKNDDKNLKDLISIALQKGAQYLSIPGSALIADIADFLITFSNERDKKLAIKRLAEFLLEPDYTQFFISTLARELTLTQNVDIKNLSANTTGIGNKLLNGIKAITAKVFLNEIDNVIKEKAKKDCEKVIIAIITQKIKSKPVVTSTDLMHLIEEAKKAVLCDNTIPTQHLCDTQKEINIEPFASKPNINVVSSSIGSSDLAPSSPSHTDSPTYNETHQLRRQVIHLNNKVDKLTRTIENFGLYSTHGTTTLSLSAQQPSFSSSARESNTAKIEKDVALLMLEREMRCELEGGYISPSPRIETEEDKKQGEEIRESLFGNDFR